MMLPSTPTDRFHFLMILLVPIILSSYNKQDSEDMGTPVESPASMLEYSNIQAPVLLAVRRQMPISAFPGWKMVRSAITITVSRASWKSRKSGRK